MRKFVTNPTDQCIEAEVLIIDSGKLWIIIDKNAVSSFVLSFYDEIGSGLGLHSAANGFQLDCNASMVELRITNQGHVKSKLQFFILDVKVFFSPHLLLVIVEGIHIIRIVKMGCIAMDVCKRMTILGIGLVQAGGVQN